MIKPSSVSFVLLEAGKSAFVVDPAEIRAIAALENVTAIGSQVQVIFNGESIPIFMPPDMGSPYAAQSGLPRLMAVSAGTDPFALACNRIGMIRADEVRLWPVPDSMAGPANQGVLIAEYRTNYAVHCALDSIAEIASQGVAACE